MLHLVKKSELPRYCEERNINPTSDYGPPIKRNKYIVVGGEDIDVIDRIPGKEIVSISLKGEELLTRAQTNITVGSYLDLSSLPDEWGDVLVAYNVFYPMNDTMVFKILAHFIKLIRTKGQFFIEFDKTYSIGKIKRFMAFFKKYRILYIKKGKILEDAPKGDFESYIVMAQK